MTDIGIRRHDNIGGAAEAQHTIRCYDAQHRRSDESEKASLRGAACGAHEPNSPQPAAIALTYDLLVARVHSFIIFGVNG